MTKPHYFIDFYCIWILPKRYMSLEQNEDYVRAPGSTNESLSQAIIERAIHYATLFVVVKLVCSIHIISSIYNMLITLQWNLLLHHLYILHPLCQEE